MKTVLLGDEIDLAYGKGLPQPSRKQGDYPVFGSNGQVDTHNQSLVKGPGIIVGRKGSVGEIVWSDKDFWPIDTTYYIKLKKPGNIRYWYYQLKALGLDKLNSHSAIPGLNRDVAYAKKIIERTQDEQDGIAKILGDIDEKIELNRRMNETLEKIGQALFKQYFIDNPEAKTWPKETIGKHCEVLLGGTPSRAKPEYWENGTVGWINSGKVNEFRITSPSEMITEEALEKSAAKLLPIGTTVLAITGATLGQVSRLEKELAANQSVIGIVCGNKPSNEFMYFWIKQNISRLIGHQTGGAQQHINKDNVVNFDLLLPPSDVIDRFQEAGLSLMNQIATNCFEVEALIKLRDSLLPPLISGRVKV